MQFTEKQGTIPGNRWLTFWACLVMGHVPHIASTQDAHWYLQRAHSVRPSERDSSIWYAQKAYDNALREKNDTLAANALFHWGMVLQSTTRLADAIAVYNKTFALKLPQNNVVQEMAYHRIGVCYSDLAVFDSALIYLLRFDSLIDANRPDRPEGKLSLSELYQSMGNSEKADQYVMEAIERARRSGRRIDRILALYYYLSDHLEHIDDPAFQPYLEEYLVLLENHNAGSRLDAVHTPLLLNTMDPNERIRLLRTAVEQYSESGDARNSTLYLNKLLSDSYRENAQWKAAIQSAQWGLAYSDKNKSTSYRLSYLKTLADLYRQLGVHDSAFFYQEKYYTLHDNVLSEEARRNFDSLRVHFETIEKEMQITAQAMEIQQKTHQRNLLLIVTAMSLLLAGFFIWYFWNRSRLVKTLAKQEALLSEQRIGQLEQEKRLLAIDAMVQGQEAERVRIAQDLHDGIGGLLSNVKAHFSVINQDSAHSDNADLFFKVNGLIDTASKEVRRISHNMAPSALRYGGLKDALVDLTAQLRRHGYEVRFDWTGADELLPEKIEIMLYRIAQELTNNIIKHAHATSILVQINRFEDDITLVIEDDGIGYDANEVKGGMGLQNVYSRVAYLKGQADIDSVREIGTTISIHIPLSVDATV